MPRGHRHHFQYLVATAQVESRFNPGAAAPTSSARGLFQFIEQTWLATLKEQGPALGYGKIADAIDRGPSGQYMVTDPRLNDRIMKLRNDPTANAVMAAAYTKENAGKLAGRLGRSPSEGELYVAHFLGSQGAGRLISLAESRPGVRTDDHPRDLCVGRPVTVRRCRRRLRRSQFQGLRRLTRFHFRNLKTKASSEPPVSIGILPPPGPPSPSAKKD